MTDQIATKSSVSVPYMSRDDIEARAKAVRRDHGLESVPIDPVVLANRLGMRVHNAKFSDDGIVGMIAKRGSNVTLLVNQNDPPYRKRFTIAHELGHHFLHLLSDGEFVDGEANLFRMPAEETEEISQERRREIQANMFAAALLMPADDVAVAWERFRSIEGLSRLFGVSEAAMAIRVNQLGLGA